MEIKGIRVNNPSNVNWGVLPRSVESYKDRNRLGGPKEQPPEVEADTRTEGQGGQIFAAVVGGVALANKTAQISADANAMPVAPAAELLTNAQVRAIRNNAAENVPLLDLWTGRTFNIFWGGGPSDGYHTDWTPMAPADVQIIQEILRPGSVSEVDWTLISGWFATSNWSTRSGYTLANTPGARFPSSGQWSTRPGVIILEGSRIAVGFHLIPHDIIIGGRPGPPLQNINNQRVPLDGNVPTGGHMCMYYGSSTGGTPRMNEMARVAHRITNNLS